MALGGGTFTNQNKVLPGAYINFVSTAVASAAVGDRGVVALGLDMSWGDTFYELTAGDFQKQSQKLLGYSYSDDACQVLRDVFKNATKVYLYRLNSDSQKASNAFSNAKFGGVRGNDLSISIAQNIDDTTIFEVSTLLGSETVDTQTVKQASELVANDYVTFKADATLTVTAKTSLTGGTDAVSKTTSHQAMLDKLESYPDINAIGYLGTDTTVKGLYTAWAMRLRDEVGIKLQAVVENYPSADSEAVVSVKNTGAVAWALGVIGGTAINESASNKKYDGETTIEADYTQSELEQAITKGEWVLHRVGSDIRVLSDINTLTTTTADKGDVFKSNQTIRVCDQIATDIASLFATKYLGAIPNDASGRTSLWADIVKHHQTLRNMRAIDDFSDEDITVAQGDTKSSVAVTDAITIINSMEKLYMTVVVS